MGDLVLLWSTFPDRADAERVARAVLEERLAACVNILAPCASIYRWQGEIKQDEEVPALFKDAKVTISGEGAQKDVTISGKDLDPNTVLSTLEKGGFTGKVK